MNRKVSLGMTIAILLLAVALSISATMMLAMRRFSSLVNDVGKRQAMYDYLEEIDTAARGQYTIDEELLRTALAEGYLEGLNDQYTAYLTADEYKQVQSELAGNRAGFGLQLMVSDDNELVVSYVEQNSPAALSGVKAGDVLTVLDEETVNGASYSAVQGKLESAEKVLLTVKQGSAESTVELTANTYSNVSVEGSLMQSTVGYIRIRSFNSQTAPQFKTMYNDLTKKGATAFVFDVRNNEGGSLEAVQEMLSYLLPSGPYATCTKKSETETYTSSDPYEITAATVTLVNGSTTGEAELFAGVLRDFSKTKLVGTSTAGKAAVQEYFTLASDKAAVRLTTGTLTLLQSGESWQNTGLLPDKTVDMSYSEMLKSELLTDEEDGQLQAALSLLQTNLSQESATAITAATAGTAGTTAAE